MDTVKMKLDIERFLVNEKVSFMDFKERASKSILHVRILDACSVSLVDSFLDGKSLTEKEVVALFAISKGFDLDDKTRYGQVFHRRLIYWLSPESDYGMKDYGMQWDDFILYAVGEGGRLLEKAMLNTVAYESNIPIVEVMDVIKQPTANPCSIVNAAPSTSYQLIKYLKTLTVGALFEYVSNVRLPSEYDILNC